MILTYRYVRKQLKKRKEAKQKAEQLFANVSQASPPLASSVSCQNNEDGTIQEPAVEGSSSWKWKILLMAALVLPVFLETLDYTVVATAQVHIASVFNRLDLQSYIGTIYLLTSTVFLPLFASFADVFGRHWTLQISLLFFLVGSAISTGSQNMPTMLAGRGVAGVGAAGLLVVVRIILADSRSLDDNNWQQSILFFLYTIGYCLGPFIGGELVQVSFRWVFAINLPCVVVAMVIAFFVLRNRVKGGMTVEQTSPTATSEPVKLTFLTKLLKIDWLGGALFMAAAKVIASFVVGGVVFIVFIFWQGHLTRKAGYNGLSSLRRALYTDPMIPLMLFKSRNVCIVMYGAFVSGMIMLVMFYFVAIFFTIVFDLPPDQAGVQLLYFAPGMGGGSILSIILITRLRQPKIPIILGAVISTVALGLISMAMQNNNKAQINGFLAMAGVGVGSSIGPLAVQVRFSQPEERVAIVSALILFFRSFGGTIGLAQCGAVLSGKVNASIRQLVASGAISGSAAASIAGASSSSDLSSIQSISSLPVEIQDLVRDAFRDATRWCFISLIPWAGVAVITSLFLSNIKDRAGPGSENSSVPAGVSPMGSEKEVSGSRGEKGSSASKVNRVKEQV